MRNWKGLSLACGISLLCIAGAAQAQKVNKINLDREQMTRQFQVPSELYTGRLPLGAAQVVRNSAAHAGPAAFGMCEDASEVLWVGDLSNQIFSYDKELALLGSIPSPALGTTTGVACIPNGNLVVLDGFPQGGGTFTETDPGTGLPTGAGTLNLPVFDANQLVGPCVYDPDSDNLWAQDIVSDTIFEFDFSGTLTGRNFANPDAPGAFGNGLSFVSLGPLLTIGTSVMDVPSGTGGEGQVTRISRGNPAAGTPFSEIVNVTFVGDTFIQDIQTSLHDGVPVHYLVGGSTGTIIEIGPPDPITTCGVGTVNAGTPPPFFADSMEGGAANWTTGAAQGVDDWAIINTGNACSGSNAWFSEDVNSIKDVFLDSVPILVPGGGATLRFSHVYNMETNFDGCVLEASIDGAPFVDLGGQIIDGGYDGLISTSFMSPISGQEAWTGQVGPPCVTTVVDLTDFAGSSIELRFRLACDSSVGDEGWYVDDVFVAEPGGGNITPVLFVNRSAPEFFDDLEDEGVGGADLFCDDMEGGDGNWSSQALGGSVAANDWAIINAGANASSPANAWFSEDVNEIKDVVLDLDAFNVPGSGAELVFQHRFNMESGFDGCVLEASTDGGSNFNDLEGDIVVGGYNGSISTSFMSPIAGQNAWTGDNTSPSEVRVDLASLAGQSVIFRFRIACDSSVGDEGWYIDDVKISEPGMGGGSADNFMTSSPTGNGNWAIITHGGSNSPTRSWFSSDDAVIKDDLLDLNEFTVTSTGSTMTFYHNYNMEAGFDGCVLEASVNGGGFFDLGPDILSGGYDGTISTSFASPIAGRDAWTGDSGLPQSQVEVDLSPYVGSDIVVRWRLACDSSVPDEGWYVDDIQVGGSDGTGGGDRTVCLAQGVDPLCIELDAAPGGPAAPLYVFYVHVGEPDFNTSTEQPFGVGRTCFPSVISGGVPQPAFILNKLGRFQKMGFSSIPQGNVPCAPGVLIKKNSGVNQNITFTCQAVLQDTFSLGDQPLSPSSDKPGSVSNAVIVKVN